MPTLHEEIITENPNQVGFWQDFTIPLSSLRTDAATPLVLGAATTPIFAITSHQARVTWAASDSAAVNVMNGWHLPRNVDTAETNHTTAKTGANLSLEFIAVKAGTTNAVTFTGTMYARTPGSATQKGPFTATDTILAAAAGTPERVILNFCASRDSNDARLEPGDIIEELQIVPSAHTTDAVYITGMTFKAKVNVPFAKDSDRKTDAT